MDCHTIVLSFRPIQIKFFQSKTKSLLVVEAICKNGSENRISPGHAALVHIRPTSLLNDTAPFCSRNDFNVSSTSAMAMKNAAERLLACSDSLPMLQKGAWVAADGSTTLAVRALANIERNRKGTRVVECIDLLFIQPDVYNGRMDDQIEFHECTDNNQECATSDRYVNHKSERHNIFSRWIVETYGTDLLSQGSGVLDVAGGNGRISQTLQTEFGVPSNLLDPNPRCDTSNPGERNSFRIIPHALNGDGSDLTNLPDDIAGTIENSSFVCGLHPDQATEPIVSLALRLNVPFAVVPCCVMPTLFPHRVQRGHGDPVRSYSAFCQYLLDMAPPGEEFRVAHLNFVGRNKVIYRTVRR
ncbi:hypothetical protein ACHAWX_003310 [Stephanocyclus meneghinianus]